MPIPIAAGVFGMARTMAASLPNAASKNEIGVPAAMESVTAEAASAANGGAAAPMLCGFTAMTMASGLKSAGTADTSPTTVTPSAPTRCATAASIGSITTKRSAALFLRQPSSSAPPIFPQPTKSTPGIDQALPTGSSKAAATASDADLPPHSTYWNAG